MGWFDRKVVKSCLILLAAFSVSLSGILGAKSKPACISIKPAPSSATLGKDQKVTLTILVTHPNSSPPRLRASIGKLSKATAQGLGSYLATYTPPWQRQADVAVVSASLADPSCSPGFIAIPLLAETKIEAKVAPHARVTLKIGNLRFGPARADAQGRVEIPAKLHPGYVKGTLEVVLPGGKKKKQTIRPGTSSRAHLEVIAVPPSLRADGHSSARLFLYATDPFGREVKKAQLQVRSAAGSIGRVVPLGRGVFGAVFKPSHSPTGGRAIITAWLLKPFRISRSVALGLAPGSKAQIQAESSVSSLVADGESKTVITAQISDGQGKGLEQLPVTITASSGRLGPVADLGGGRYQAELIAPVGGAGSMVLKVRTGTLEHTLTLPLSAPEPLTVSVDPPELIADGRSQTRLEIRAFGPTADPEAAEVMLAASGGTVPERVTLKGTRAEAFFRAGTRAGVSRVTIHLGAASSSVEIPLLPGPPAKLKLSTPRAEVLADGKAALPITAEVTDVNGNPVPDARVVLSASVGQLDPPHQQSPGHLTTWFRPPAGATGVALIRAASTGDLAEELQVRLREPPKIFGLSIAAGIEHNLARIGAPRVSLETSYRLAGTLFFLAGVGYFGNQIDAACTLGPAGCDSKLRLDVVPLWLGVGLRFENGTSWTPTIQAGAAAVFSRVVASPSFQEEMIETNIAPAGFARAGLELAAGPGGIVVELGYLYAPWTGSEAINGGLGGISAQLGYRFAL